MFFVPTLFLLSQAAPPAGLPQPVELTPALVAVSAAPPVRAALLDGIVNVPARRSYRFACLAVASTGEMVECIPIGGSYGPPVSDPLAFGQRRDAFVARLRPSDDDKLEWAAYRLARFRKLIPTEPASPDALPTTRHVLVTETIEPADRVVPEAAPANRVERTDIQFEAAPDGAEMARNYPGSALRTAATAAISATCVIGRDRALFCRDGRVTNSSVTLADSVQQDFVLAAYQTLYSFRVAPRTKSGQPAVGKNATLTIRFQLPGS